ncbi:MAG: hypothetical protein HC764_18425 [Pleurocapsa sp. CRU_1_2]|nr:hypothetical protein [Pleurocapsa sp. CRU_1_2]
MKTFLLSDICKIEIGRTPARANPLFWGGEHPWLSISDMGKYRDIHTTKEGITDLGTETFNGRVVKPGTLLFSFKLSIGKIGIARVPLYTNEAIAALPIKDRLLACEEYLYYALQGLNFDTTTDRAVMGKTLNKKKLAQINIPLPPLEDQKRIAAILDKADAIRRKRKEAIALTEELLRSTFLDMFGEPVTNPQGWDVLKLGSQVDELKYGTNAKCSEFHKKEDILVLRIPNIVEEKICWNDLKYAKLESSEVDKLLLKQGDLLFVRSNGNPDRGNAS